MRDNFLSNLKLVVVKVGASTFSSRYGLIDKFVMGSIARQVCRLMEKGVKVVMVSSGAISAGMNLLGLRSRPKTLQKLQAVAAIGQNQLMKAYEENFKPKGKMVAQVLLTWDDLEDRNRYINAKNTINTILAYGAIPIINENDTISAEEIKFGDNDTLASLVTTLIDADLLIILSDVDGLYRRAGNNEVIEVVNKIDVEIEKLGGGTRKETSVGGMATKLKAAKVVTGAGVPLVIANGKTDNILVRIAEKEPLGTLFIPKLNKMTEKKRWIAFSTKPKGSILVDSGAKLALIQRNKSLLPSGVIGVEGRFSGGDIISIKDDKSELFARGLANYSSSEIERIKGVKTADIELTLGYRYYDEVVHKDNLVLI